MGKNMENDMEAAIVDAVFGLAFRVSGFGLGFRLQG